MNLILYMQGLCFLRGKIRILLHCGGILLHCGVHCESHIPNIPSSNHKLTKLNLSNCWEREDYANTEPFGSFL